MGDLKQGETESREDSAERGGFELRPRSDSPLAPDDRVRRREPVERNERRFFQVDRPRAALPLPHQRQTRKRGALILAILGGIVGLGGTIYFAFFAAPRYVVETHFTVRTVTNLTAAPASSGGSGGSSGALSNPATSGGLTSTAVSSFSDSYMAAEYLRSPTVVADVGRVIDLRQIFAAPDGDFIERLDPKASQERLARYWPRRVVVDYDPITATIVMQAEAFSATDAFKLSETTMQAVTDMVNTMDQRGREETLRLAEDYLQKSQTNLNAATKRLNDFQNSKETLDPLSDATSQQALIATLQGNLATANAQLAAMTSLGTANGPARNALVANIESLQRQLAIEQHKLTQANSGAGGKPVTANLLSEIQHLQVERSFAESDYAAALQAVEMAQAVAASTARYIVTYIRGEMPTQPIYPQRIRMIAMVWIVTAVGTAIAALVYATVREQML